MLNELMDSLMEVVIVRCYEGPGSPFWSLFFRNEFKWFA